MSTEPRRAAREGAALGLRTFVVDDPREAGEAIAGEIAALVAAAAAAGRGIALGLASGRTPICVYASLARRQREQGLDLSGLTTFNLDEYLGLGPEHPSSFQAWMRRVLFDHVDVPPANVHIPDGRVAAGHAAAACDEYERAIRAAGGIELQILGIGRNGHIAFNEPGSARDSRTRVVRLSEDTRRANRGDFPDGQEVPERAITMGIGTILEARRLRVLAFGAHKAEIVRRTLCDPIGPELPSTFLREHPDVELWSTESHRSPPLPAAESGGD